MVAHVYGVDDVAHVQDGSGVVAITVVSSVRVLLRERYKGAESGMRRVVAMDLLLKLIALDVYARST